jgi:hypothetical protein
MNSKETNNIGANHPFCLQHQDLLELRTEIMPRGS